MKTIDDLIKHAEDVEVPQLDFGEGWWNTYNKTGTIPIDPATFPKEDGEREIRMYMSREQYDVYQKVLHEEFLDQTEGIKQRGRATGRTHDREVAMEIAMKAQKAQQEYNLAIAKLEHEMSKTTLKQQLEKQEKIYEDRESNEEDVRDKTIREE